MTGRDGAWTKLSTTLFTAFEDLVPRTTYNNGDSFTSAGISFSAMPFLKSDGTWNTEGFATVFNSGIAGGTGNEIATNNINIRAEFPCPTVTVSFKYGDKGGYVNLGINNDLRHSSNLVDLDGSTIGGVNVTVTADAANRGTVTLKGKVRELWVGGQELAIDDIDAVCRNEDMAFALVTEDYIPYCEGDFDRDGDVDGKDLAVFAMDFNHTDCHESGDCEGDFNYDGKVNDLDLAVFAPDYGRQDCPCATRGGTTVEHDTEITFPVNDLVLDIPSTGPELISLTGTMDMDVYFEGPAEGDAQDDDGDGLDEVKTQIVSLNLHGMHPFLGPISLKLNPDFNSTGEIEETSNILVGRLDVPPFGPDGSTADSFFDVYVEIEVAGQKRYSKAPLRFSGVITKKPLGDDDVFRCISPEPVELFNEAGYPTGEALGCVEPTGACCIGERCQELTEPECEERGGEYKGPYTECDEELCGTE